MSSNDEQCDACSKPWAVHVVMGCVHEHMGDVRFCVDHQVRLDGELVCVPCVNDHACAVRVVATVAVSS